MRKLFLLFCMIPLSCVAMDSDDDPNSTSTTTCIASDADQDPSLITLSSPARRVSSKKSNQRLQALQQQLKREQEAHVVELRKIKADFKQQGLELKTAQEGWDTEKDKQFVTKLSCALCASLGAVFCLSIGVAAGMRL